MTGTNAPPMLVSRSQSGQTSNDIVFVNTTWKDMEVYGYLSGQRHSSRLLRPFSRLWRQPQQQVKHMDLVHHCKLQTTQPDA